MRVINRLLFALARINTIPAQFLLGRRILPNPSGEVIVPTKDGILLKLDVHADAGSQLRGSIDRNLYYLGTYEVETTEIIRRFLREDGVFIDIGSHNGSIALFASKVAKRGSVIAFEPVSALQMRLQENIDLNHAENITPVQLALGARKDKLSINVNLRNRGSSSLHKAKGEIYEGQEEVLIDTLDSQLARQRVKKVNMIKIDVEGFEMSVLEGSARVLSDQQPYLIIEHDPKNENVREPFEFITGLGIYSIYIPKYGRHIKGPLVQVNSYDEMPQDYVTNIVCIPSRNT